jgi:hypothetical protein
MRCVMGLVGADRGEVLWRGRPVGPAERLRFGYMPEERGLYPRMVADALAEWHDFCAAVAEAGGSLLGLVVVGITIHLGRDPLGLRTRALGRGRSWPCCTHGWRPWPCCCRSHRSCRGRCF